MAGKQGPYPIDALDLPTRARNALVRAGITMPEELVARSDAELLALRGLGPTGLAQVRERLAAWERERGPDDEAPAEAPEARVEPEGELGHAPLTLLPGRQVLHATWMPGSPGCLFLWGEGKPISNLQSPISILHPPSSILQPPLPRPARRAA